MGLNDNTHNISIALSEKNRLEKQRQLERLKKEAERKKKIEQKENRKRLEEDIKELITGEFQKYFDVVGEGYTVEFYSLERKQEILNDCITNFGILKEEQYLNGEIQDFYHNKKEITEIFNKKYYKILKEQEKIYKLNDKYKYHKMLEEYEPPKENKKKLNHETLLKIFKIIGYIVFIPIILLIMVIIGLCKDSK